MRSVLVLLVLTTGCGGGCGDRKPPPPVPRDAQQHRTIEPPSVRPLPPYLITATEVGPYKLGQALYALPSTQGANSSRFHIDRVLHTNLTHTEDNTVLLGSEIGSPPTKFVVVLDGEVARTESGLHVGLSRKELDGAPLIDDPRTARDPRLLAPVAPRGMRIVLAQERIAALVILGEGPAPARDDGPPCLRPAAPEGRIATCMGGGETVAIEGEDVVVHSLDNDRVVGQVRVPGLVFAAPLRNAAEGKDELIVIAQQQGEAQRTWSVFGFRIEANGRRSTVVEPAPLYQISSSETRWFGVELRDIELYLELISRDEGIEVGGLLTTRVQRDKIRDLVVLSPVTVPRRKPARPIAPNDAGVPDESSPAGPAAPAPAPAESSRDGDAGVVSPR